MENVLLFLTILCIAILVKQIDLSVITTAASSLRRNNKIIVVSFDGFPVRYLKNGTNYPTFDKIRNEGVFSESFQNVFPGETFPNHFSLVTGLYAESHGIVSNLFYDPVIGKDFSSKRYEIVPDYQTQTWWAAEPIWVTTGRLNLAKVATSMWPGDLVRYQPGNWTPYRSRPDYTAHVPFEERVDQVIRWLIDDDVDLALMFHFEPDDVGHYAGVTGPFIERAVATVDHQIGYMLTAIEKAGLSDRVDLILCSDHAMSNIERRIFLDDYLNFNETIERISRIGARADLWPRQGYEDYVYQTLKKAADMQHGVFEVYRRDETPERFHYRNNPRIAPIIVLGNDGTAINSSTTTDLGLLRYRAIHGWDPAAPWQQPIFLACGPSFKKGGYNATETTRGMSTKDIYAILIHLLKLDYKQMPPNNSTFELVKDLFTQ